MRKFHIIIFSLLAGIQAYAQDGNLNPTVQVTNTYENKLRDINKAAETAVIPDSLYKFDLDFDYTGFENPYLGNDEFNPFLTDLDIASRTMDNKQFYLKAGAGFSLHPVFDLTWDFVRKSGFQMDVYANHRSYFGNYWNIVPNEDRRLVDNGGSDYGFSSATKAGLDALVNWESCRLKMNANYDGEYAKMPDVVGTSPQQRSYNAGGFSMDFASTPDMEADYWRFAAKAGYVFSRDNRFTADALTEHNLDIKLACAYDFVNGHSIEVDADAFASFAQSYTGAGVVLTPRYLYSGNRFTIAVGAGILCLGGNADKGKSPFSVFPSLRLEWNAVPGWMDVFADADINGRFRGARAQALADRFYIPDQQLSIVKTRTVDAGIRGCLFEKLQYKLTVALDMAENMPLYSVDFLPGRPISIAHDNLNNGRFELELSGKFGGFSLAANACYRLFMNPSGHNIVPPSFTAGVDMRYSVRSRVVPYIGFKFVNNSLSNGYTIPWSYDLYAGVEWKITRKFALFIDGSNLLNQRIQHIPLVSERGVSVTGGIILNF